MNEKRKLKLARGLCTQDCCKQPAIKGQTLCPEHKTKHVASCKRSLEKLKVDTFNTYGGARCSCCGETELWILCLDHVNNDGWEERQRLSNTGGYKFYRYLKSLGYPDKDRYRVLCANCNFSIYANGVCHHKRVI